MKRRSFLLLPLLGLCSVSVHATDFWVGSGSGCDYPTIPQALSIARTTPEADTIRIAKNGAYLDQALRLDISVTLIGGYPTCGATDRDGYTAVIGSRREAVLSVAPPPGDSIEVHLDRLDISKGGWNRETAHWGGMSISGNARVHLYDSVVRDNRAARFEFGVNYGGGITVRGPNAELIIERWVDIRENYTEDFHGDGGGILVDGGKVRIRPHGVTIKQNRAEIGHGGGIAIVNGGSVEVAVDPDGPELPVDGVLVGFNQSYDCGGGILVDGPGSQLLANSLVVDYNEALDGGAGMCVLRGGLARLDAQRTPGQCPPGKECLSLSYNRGRFNGVAVQVFGDSIAHLDGVVVRGNLLHDPLSALTLGNPFAIAGNNSVLTVVNSVVVDNACDPAQPNCAAFRTEGGRLRLAHSTFARNGNEGGGLIYADASSTSANVVDAKILSNLIADKEHIYVSERSEPPIPEATIDLWCAMKNRGRPEGVNGALAPITFVDAAGGNYRLAPGNLAIDYCDGVAAPWSLNPDLDRRPRGADDPFHPNRDDAALNTFEPGAYEFHAVYDRVFASGFDTSP